MKENKSSAEPVAESEAKTYAEFFAMNNVPNNLHPPKKRDEVAEKPEGESQCGNPCKIWATACDKCIKKFNEWTEANEQSAKPEAEPVESAEESKLEILNKVSERYGYALWSDVCHHAFAEETAKITEEAMEEYASLRVAQALKKPQRLEDFKGHPYHVPGLPNAEEYHRSINFWSRLQRFVKEVNVNDPMSEEEKQMILRACDGMLFIESK